MEFSTRVNNDICQSHSSCVNNTHNYDVFQFSFRPANGSNGSVRFCFQSRRNRSSFLRDGGNWLMQGDLKRPLGSRETIDGCHTCRDIVPFTVGYVNPAVGGL